MNNKQSYFLFSPIIIVIIWFVVSYFKIIGEFFLPSPISVLGVFMKMNFNNNFVSDIYFTCTRTVIGFSIACIFGIPLGLIMGYSKTIDNIFGFSIHFFRNIPVTAFFPLFIIFFGIGEMSKYAVSFWASFLILVINTISGVHSGKKIRLSAAKLLRVNKWMIFKNIILFEAFPQIFIGMRVAFSMAFIVVIVTEMSIGTDLGLGRRIIDAQLMYKTDELYASIIVSGILGFVINQSFLYFEKKLFFWQGK